MEFSFDVNKVLPQELTLLRSKDIVLDRNTDLYHKNKDGQIKAQLAKVIDSMGVASGKAQNLRGAITSSFRLKSSDHHLFLLKGPNINNGLGCVIGMIKVGFKRLFLLDNYGQQHECQPLCVLDFYVHESKQRSGYGKRLFNHMLHAENVQPHELAVDRPSVKFINFLARHYSLDKPIHQVNNFIVFDLFFKDMTAVGGADARSRRSAPLHRKMTPRLSSNREPRCFSASVCNNQVNSLALQDMALSRQLSLLPPIDKSSKTKESEASTNCELDHMAPTDQSDSLLRNCTPQASNSDTQIRNFSRHSARQTSRSCPTMSTIKSGTNDGGGNGKRVQFNDNPEVYTLPACSKNDNLQVTSLNNYSCGAIPKVESSSGNVNESYTIDKVMARINSSRDRLGTGWNLFGVPNNCSLSSNPYGSMRRRGFPR